VSDSANVDAVAESMGLPPEAVIAQPEGAGVEPAAGRIGVILGIDLPVIVRFGRTELPIRSLSKIGPGSVIELGRSPDDPVDVLVGDRVVARGEVVIVGGNYGVRILEVITNPFRERRAARGAGIAPGQEPAAKSVEA
jgi:flagellar motor switch protein FliN/FliY